MPVVLSPDEIRDANTRYHDVAASTYDLKWGIDFGETGQTQVLGKLRKLLGPRLDDGFESALEIGAGTGYFSLNLAQRGVLRRATCTDISPAMVTTLRDNADRLGLTNVTATRAEADSLPFADASFDLVIGHAVLHHLPDLERAFAEFMRVLAPGGWIVFAGEPSRVGDTLARVPKRAACLVAPTWRRLAGARPVAVADNGSGGGGGGNGNGREDGNGNGNGGGNGNGREDGNGAGSARAGNGEDHRLEAVVDVHAFAPAELEGFARRAGFVDVAVRGEELLANWFGWFNRGLEASANPDEVPDLWRQYAFHGYLLLQRLDARVLEPRLPPAIFYNLLLCGRRP